MDCPSCKEPTKVTHTYPVGTTRVIQRKCPNGHKHVLVTQYLHEVTCYGRGAYAIAQRLEHEEEDPKEEGAPEG